MSDTRPQYGIDGKHKQVTARTSVTVSDDGLVEINAGAKEFIYVSDDEFRAIAEFVLVTLAEQAEAEDAA